MADLESTDAPIEEDPPDPKATKDEPNEEDTPDVPNTVDTARKGASLAGAGDALKKAPPHFERDEEQIASFRAFLSRPPSEMTLDELYTELKSIQGSRMSKQKKKKVRTKKEKEAKWMVDLLNALPENARKAISALPAAQRKTALKKIAEELNKSKAVKVEGDKPETTVAKN